jgi:DNA-binding NtrC family response regulator
LNSAKTFFHLNTFTFQLPTPPEKREDILVLARYFHDFFSQKYSKKNLKGFTPDAEEELQEYKWPGNIRELKNVVEGCIVLANTELISLEHLPLELCAERALPFVERRKNPQLILPEKGISLDEVEKDLIRQSLDRAGGNQTKAAKLLNMSYETLRYQIKKYNLK